MATAAERIAVARAELRAGRADAAWSDAVSLAAEKLRPEHVMALAQLLGGIARAPIMVPRKRVAVLGEVTTKAISAAAAVALAGESILADIVEAPYGTLQQHILDPTRGVLTASPDIVLLAPSPDGAARESESPAAIASAWRARWEAITAVLPATHIVHHLFESPDDELLGIAERRATWTPFSRTEATNRALIDAALAAVHLVDMELLSAHIGKRSWHDPRLWHHGRVPFATRHIDAYRLMLQAAFRRALGRTRKALIVDLDNTLWNGVIGDDGIDGIRLGPGDPAGEAHASFCDYVQALGRRGVILGICSKNDPAALQVFDSHPHMKLRRDDFAAIRCNWSDKASNLREIAAELNIDASTIVYVDDNPAECALIRREIPSIAVVELAGDPSGFVRALDELRLFQIETVSAEDLNRTSSYRARRLAAAERTASTNIDDFLRSLEMRGEFARARKEDIARLAQMEAKTNQFNLTTRRYTATQISQLMADPQHAVFTFRLADRFADHGLVSSIVLRVDGDMACIDSWLMSCRIFARTAEEFMVSHVADWARKSGARLLVGEHLPTERNAVVADLYPRLGFAAISSASGRRFELDLTRAVRLPRSFIAAAAPRAGIRDDA
jgi:FkbH-like protein